MPDVRLLLTSSGITNAAIESALVGLLNDAPAKCHLAFVPTAANVETGDKGWLIDDLVNLRNVGFGSVDISALSGDQWLPRLEQADVIAVGGGCTPHLLSELARTGAAAELPALLCNRVYVGISAGSIAAGREAIPALSNDLYGEDTPGCLGLADLVFLPHLDSPEFPRVTETRIRSNAAGVAGVYALDDASALTAVDGLVELVGEGRVLQL